MPHNAIYVGRPTEWGNPWVVRSDLPAGSVVDERRAYVTVDDAKFAVDTFRDHLVTTLEGKALADKARRKLRGIDLCCWCPLDAPCHADVLLEVANRD